jgi:hypothetical protein
LLADLEAGALATALGAGQRVSTPRETEFGLSPELELEESLAERVGWAGVADVEDVVDWEDVVELAVWSAGFAEIS